MIFSKSGFTVKQLTTQRGVLQGLAKSCVETLWWHFKCNCFYFVCSVPNKLLHNFFYKLDFKWQHCQFDSQSLTVLPFKFTTGDFGLNDNIDTDALCHTVITKRHEYVIRILRIKVQNLRLSFVDLCTAMYILQWAVKYT